MQYKKTDGDAVFFRRVKKFVIFWLVFAILLTAFIIYESSLQGGESSNHARVVINWIKDNFSVNSIISPQKIEIDQDSLEYGKDTYCFTGEKIWVPITFTPENSSHEVEYTFTDENGDPVEGCSVDEFGFITYTGTDVKRITVTATSIHAPDVSDSAEFLFRSIGPDNECVEDIEVHFCDPADGESYSADELLVGKKYEIQVYLIIKDEYIEKYSLESNHLHVPSLPFNLYLDGKNRTDLYLFDETANHITFYKDISGKLEFKFRKSSSTLYESIGAENTNRALNIAVRSDESYDYMPKSPLKLNTDGIESIVEAVKDDEYIIRIPAGTRSIELETLSQGGNINPMAKLTYADEESKSVARIENRMRIVRSVNFGECNINLVSVFDESIVTKITVIFDGYTPTKLSIYGKNTLLIENTETYTASYNEKLYDEDGVTWSIVKGENIAEFVDGKLTPKALGTVVIRATGIHYPELEAEIEIDVRLWEDFSGLIRKMIGHFALFLLAGLAYFICFYFLIKKRIYAYILTPAFIFAVAELTEIIQSFTPGRSGLWRDVLLDFFSGLAGMLLFLVLYLIYLAIQSLFIKGGYGRMKECMPEVCFKKLFKNKE